MTINGAFNYTFRFPIRCFVLKSEHHKVTRCRKSRSNFFTTIKIAEFYWRLYSRRVPEVPSLPSLLRSRSKPC